MNLAFVQILDQLRTNGGEQIEATIMKINISRNSKSESAFSTY